MSTAEMIPGHPVNPDVSEIEFPPILPVAFTELPHVLRFNTGPTVTDGQLRESLHDFQPRMPLRGILALARPGPERPWRKDVDETVGYGLESLAQFIEGGVSRTDRAVIFEASTARMADERTIRGLSTFANEIRRLGGVSMPHHTVRHDAGAKGQGTIVTAARFSGGETSRDCFIIESTIPTGTGNNTNRRLEIFAPNHPGLMSAVNAYSYPEWRAAREYLRYVDTADSVRKIVLSQAGRLTAPDKQGLDNILKLVIEQQEEELRRASSPITTGELPVLLGVAAMEQMQGVKK